MLDLDYLEDSSAETDANFVMTGKGGIVEIQGTAEGEPFSEEEFAALMGLAKKGIARLVDLQTDGDRPEAEHDEPAPARISREESALYVGDLDARAEAFYARRCSGCETHHVARSRRPAIVVLRCGAGRAAALRTAEATP